MVESKKTKVECLADAVEVAEDHVHDGQMAAEDDCGILAAAEDLLASADST